MSTTILFAAGANRWSDYAAPLKAALTASGVTADLVTDAAPERVDYIVYAPDSALKDFTPYTSAKAVLNIWAGVERIASNPTLTQPLARMVDASLTEGMVEWVTGHVLRHHLGLDAHVHGLSGWDRVVPPLARDRRVGILGLGALGSACAGALAALNFDMAAWSRRPKPAGGIPTHHGDAGLHAVLDRSEILVLLLPLTTATRHVIDAAALARMPPGAVLINSGRGPLVDDDALIAALDTGHLGHATLDVFDEEPLPAEHPFWSHRKVTVTPHIASETRPAAAARVIAENIRRGEAGAPLLHLVDRATGY